MECPNCGSSEHVIPVWETVESFNAGNEPKYIGCTECRMMVRNNGV